MGHNFGKDCVIKQKKETGNKMRALQSDSAASMTFPHKRWWKMLEGFFFFHSIQNCIIQV